MQSFKILPGSPLSSQASSSKRGLNGDGASTGDASAEGPAGDDVCFEGGCPSDGTLHAAVEHTESMRDRQLQMRAEWYLVGGNLGSPARGR